MDAAEEWSVQLLGLDEVAELGVRLERARLVERELNERVLDLVDDAAGPEDADLAGLRVDPTWTSSLPATRR